MLPTPPSTPCGNSPTGSRTRAITSPSQPPTSLSDHYRVLASTDPDTFLPKLASGLNNLSIRLGALGRHEDALTAIQEALTVRRELAAARPDTFLPDLATSLNNLSILLSQLGRSEDALTAIEAALTVRRKLAVARPAVHQAALEQSLRVLSRLQGGKP